MDLLKYSFGGEKILFDFAFSFKSEPPRGNTTCYASVRKRCVISQTQTEVKSN